MHGKKLTRDGAIAHAEDGRLFRHFEQEKQDERLPTQIGGYLDTSGTAFAGDGQHARGGDKRVSECWHCEPNLPVVVIGDVPLLSPLECSEFSPSDLVLVGGILQGETNACLG
ncbi:hypothetical protein [Mesorhizobium sp. WSM3626]|uniref:hypothetical protein n=1 Tax=Mesorhizobium sp. WSM3626 TaxID=1040987 RepID=UPI00047FD478|nr:hypothetical protein [Mesorhizobium sp. WSM3626]